MLTLAAKRAIQQFSILGFAARIFAHSDIPDFGFGSMRFGLIAFKKMLCKARFPNYKFLIPDS